ncbi:hypothetical protein Val02_38040 [Virgisporangium aliadipatigenens]|uniref:Uncharacterized protein n=1 Tax=Virgisporangium aliadipatigenens TaxID=741659 RepID=A0A8J4DRL9_9ACTN|nr:hypothetical protein [Virgisporangium aliadipatigenens]GIJ46918.1 hypothetical protein Val02_38040 [Virgisporangium aliadipatigenens]
MISSEPESSSEESPAEEPQFANRAERRAHGKAKGAQQHTESRAGQHFARRGNVQQPRQYGNRRSG